MKNKGLGRIGILMGGPSSEREISLMSGRAVYEALLAIGVNAVCIDPKDSASVKEDILRAKIDVAFIALHGRFGEDGTIQNVLQEINIPYTGSGPKASRLALNKVLSKQIFQKNGIPVPRYKVIKRPVREEALLSGFAFPLVIKPANEGSSIGLTLVEDKKEFMSAVDKAFSYDDEVLIEEYIEGEDLTVGVLEDKPLPVIHIKPKARFYSFEAKYTAGMSEYIVPADIDKGIAGKVQELGLLAHRILGCRCFSRTDLLLGENNNIVVLEVNTIPGLTSSSLLPKAAAAVGIDFPQMCLRMIRSALPAGSGAEKNIKTFQGRFLSTELRAGDPSLKVPIKEDKV